MKRSLSNPTLTATKKMGIPRNVSVPVSMFNIVQDVVLEIQAEAVTHTPAYVAAACSTSHMFPLDLIKNQTPNSLNESAVLDIGACIACPPDGECTSSFDEEAAPRRQLAWMLSRSKTKVKKNEESSK